jgi:DNA adenine methylase
MSDLPVDSEVSSLGCRPLLRWAGSKLKLLPTLSEFWRGDHKRYIEPFAGSACLYFHLAPESAILGDNNAELIELYEVVREQPSVIAARLAAIERDAPTYYAWRAQDPARLDRTSRAVRFLYLNRHCFNGIYRTNRAGKFNVPFGSKLGEPLTGSDIESCARRLLGAELVAGDFERTVSRARAGDLVYMDPPFAMAKKRNRGEYGSAAFGCDDIDRLNDALFALDALGAHFVVSYGDCLESRMLAKNWHHRRVRVRRHVAGFASQRKSAYELIIHNFEPEKLGS